jgi:hypothetical protein
MACSPARPPAAPGFRANSAAIVPANAANRVGRADRGDGDHRARGGAAGD